ncbi:MAG: FAD-dependent oxidoreductase [Burkholderiaceae bacterium]
MPDADVLIVGGGIAGLSAAYFATQAGRGVTIIDEGVHRTSDLPVALINPLRGRNGRLVADGVEGMQASFALIAALRDAGHAIQAGQGLHRPLIGVAPEALVRSFWAERIGERMRFDWHDVAPVSLGLVEPVPSLFLHEAGWVAAGTLLDALRAASEATVVSDRVTCIDREVVTLASGIVVTARTLLWCGGAWGAALLDGDIDRAAEALYKPGSLLAVDAVLTSEPLSFGLYAAPWIDAGDEPSTLVGPTREGSSSSFPESPLPAEAMAHLADRIARVFGSTMPPREAWRGVRLTRMSSPATTALAGIPTLTALGSRGFLMAPLLAQAWSRSL